MKLIKALKKIVYIIFFLLFNRDNWFRKYLLNDLKLQKLINGSLSGDTEDLLDNLFNLSNSRLKQAMFNKPFNDQITRKEIVKDILESIQFDKIIETGTLLGNTTEFFQKFNIPVVSIEISEFYFLVSKITSIQDLRGKWTNFTLEMLWKNDETGIANLWLDGKQVLSHRGRTLTLQKENKNYFLLNNKLFYNQTKIEEKNKELSR